MKGLLKTVIVSNKIFWFLWLSLFFPCTCFAASLAGKVADQTTGQPIQSATVTLGDLFAQSDSSGNFSINNIAPSHTYLLTATAHNYNDAAEKLSISDGQNTQNIILASSGEYSGDADAEYTITITDAAAGNAHIQCIFRNVEPSETMKLDMHYVFDDFITIQNIVAKDKIGNDLPHALTIREDYFYWYELTIENSSNTEVTLEYDIHYVTICHDGNPECYHGYLCSTYGVFENMNHILFAGASGYNYTGEITAVRFRLPTGWVAITPWERTGDYYVGNSDDMLYAAPAVGRFELHRLPVNSHTVIIGIHKDANTYAPLHEKWPITIESLQKGLNAANQINAFDSDHSVVIGVPPLGPNEGAVNSVYSPADNFPASFWGLSGMDDISWCEDRWTSSILEYFGEIILYSSGFYSNTQYRRLIDEVKDTYLNQIYGTAADKSVADFEVLPNSTEKQNKTKLFAYVLDKEIRAVSSDGKSLSEAMLYWRHNIDHYNWTNNDAITLLSDFASHDFTDFFNRFFFGNQKLPVDGNWYYSSQHPMADAGADQSVDEGRTVVLDASGSHDPYGDIISYYWKQINGPTVNLVNETSNQPTFEAPLISDPDVQTIQVDFEVIIRYRDYLWDADDVSVVVRNLPSEQPSGSSGGGGGCVISSCLY